MTSIFRIQDKHGRGPWRPGFSQRWVEPRDDHQVLRSWLEEWPNLRLIAAPSSYYGCGCETIGQCQRWFTYSEYRKLVGFGYRCVRLEVERILAKSDTQCVFVRHRPLRKGVTVVNLYER